MSGESKGDWFMRKIVTAAAAAAMCFTAPAFAQVVNGGGVAQAPSTHDNPSSCLGAERATRNSNGGDRAQGGFGQAQSDYVHSLQGTGQSYGQFLQSWMSNCTNPPGGTDDDEDVD
jgi:opacity protein-like surface antigen